MSVSKLFGYGVGGFLLLGILLPKEDTDAREPPKQKQAIFTSTPSAVETPLSLPNDPAKTAEFRALPQPAALKIPQQPTTEKITPKVAPKHVYVTGSRVRLRAGPSTQNNIVGGFNKGTQLVLHGTQEGWARVSGQAGGVPVKGWMSAKYLSSKRPVIQKAALPKKPKRQVAVPSSNEVSRARKALINQSIASYPGNCPCPYNRDRAGRKCGKRSAWSRPGGRSPLCYDSDVNRSRLTSYFARKGKVWP